MSGNTNTLQKEIKKVIQLSDGQKIDVTNKPVTIVNDSVYVKDEENEKWIKHGTPKKQLNIEFYLLNE